MWIRNPIPLLQLKYTTTDRFKTQSFYKRRRSSKISVPSLIDDEMREWMLGGQLCFDLLFLKYQFFPDFKFNHHGYTFVDFYFVNLEEMPYFKSFQWFQRFIDYEVIALERADSLIDL